MAHGAMKRAKATLPAAWQCHPLPSKATQSQTKNTKQRLVINGGGGAGAAVAAATVAASQIRAGLVVAMFC